MKTLKTWNGRGYVCRKYNDPRWKDNDNAHANVCAYSRADARRVIKEYCGIDPGDAELKDYWSQTWGTSMEGIELERGLWIEFEYRKPTRVI